MKKVYFKSLLIYDATKGRAFKTEFEAGVNVVTSEENHVGKSCLVKSLYYALGADVNFAKAWDQKNKTIALTFSIGATEYQIIRSHKSFLLIDGDGNARFCTKIGSELNAELSKIFDFSVYLQNRKTKKYEMAPPAFTYLPYYIDQDKGWASEMYTSFENLAQYNKQERSEYVLYHLKVRATNTALVCNQVVDSENKYEAKLREKEKLEGTLRILEKETGLIQIASEVDEVEKIVESEKSQIELTLKQIAESRRRIHDLQEELSFFKMQVLLLRKKCSGKNHNSDRNIRCCSRCGYIDEEAIYDFANHDFYEKNTKYIVRDINDCIARIESAIQKEMDEYASLSVALNENYKKNQEQNFSYDAYIRYLGLTASIQNLNNQIRGLSQEISMLKNKLLELKGRAKNIRNEERKENLKVQQKYQAYTRQFMSQLDVGIADASDIDITEPLKNIAQGANLPKMIIALQAALLETMNAQESAVLFPFVVDSPGTMEASDNSKLDILKLLKRLDYLPQVIISTVDYAKLCNQPENNVNVITLSSKTSLLSRETYKTIEEEVDNIENRFRIAKNMYTTVARYKK